MAEKSIILDGFGRPFEVQDVPPSESIAAIGAVADPWAGKTTGQVTPESLARLLLGSAELSDQMLLIQRMLRDDHVSSCMRNLANAVSRLEWEVLPFDDSAPAKKLAEEMTDFLNKLRWLKKGIRQLVYGEFYPFVGLELIYDPDTYLPTRFERVNPGRWTLDKATNSLRLRTIKERTKGEPVNPMGWMFHHAELEPGTIRDAGLWQKCAWLWMFKNTSWGYWMRFAEAFGAPYIFGYYNRPEDKDSVFRAVTEMAANARGVFPAGTEIKIQEAQRYGTVHLYQSIKEAAEAGITKAIQGHMLNTDAKSGTGTLAGGAAQHVSQENKEGVADGINEAVRSQLLAPQIGFRYGWDLVKSGEIPTFKLKATPPVDLDGKAKTYVEVNKSLAAAKRAIDPSQIEDEFAVRTVSIAGDEPEDEDSADKKKPAVAAKHSRMRASVSPEPSIVIATLEAVEDLAIGAAKASLKEMTTRMRAKLDAATSLEDLGAVLFESYDEFDVQRLATINHAAIVTSELVGRGDVLDA